MAFQMTKWDILTRTFTEKERIYVRNTRKIYNSEGYD